MALVAYTYPSKEFSMNLKKSRRLPLLVLLAVSSLPAGAQSIAQPDPLFKTIQSLDTKLFDAYNHCDLTTLGAMVSDDLEFYHDQTGLSVGKEPFLAAIKQNICGKVERALIPDTLEVYPLKGYGAVEIGVHRFHHPGRPEDGVGDAKFVTLWQNKDGAWKVTRVISYNHNHGLLAK
jgi:ketosteroid isomerase-like protein